MNLAGTTPGATYTCVMTASALNPSAGTVYRVEWGNGTGTPLYLGNGIVGIGTSSTSMSQFTSEATALHSVVIPDEPGRVQLSPLTGTRTVVLGSDFTHNTTSAVNVTGMVLTLPVGTWMVVFSGLVKSNDVDSGVLLTAHGTGATVLGGTFQSQQQSSPSTNFNFGRTGMVLVQVSSGTGTVQLQAANEGASRTLTVVAGSVLAAVRTF